MGAIAGEVSGGHRDFLIGTTHHMLKADIQEYLEHFH